MKAHEVVLVLCLAADLGAMAAPDDDLDQQPVGRACVGRHEVPLTYGHLRTTPQWNGSDEPPVSQMQACALALARLRQTTGIDGRLASVTLHKCPISPHGHYEVILEGTTEPAIIGRLPHHTLLVLFDRSVIPGAADIPPEKAPFNPRDLEQWLSPRPGPPWRLGD